MAVSVISAQNLERLRRDRQWSRLHLCIHQPATIYSARVNQTFATTDGVAQVTYNNGVGNLSEVLVGMTIWVGTSPGEDNVGRCRVRALPTATQFFLGETSEIAWADGLYLTVVDEIGLWPRHPRIIDNVMYQDYDIAYSDQHSACDPYPVMGSDAVLILRGGPATIGFDASSSFVIGAASIIGYSWNAPGSLTISGADTATPTITYDAPGTYRVACTVTASNGKTMTGYRYVFVYEDRSMPEIAFQLESLSGAEMGWRFRVRIYSQIPISILRDQAQVILFAEDYYGDEAISLGPVAGRENIICRGWIIGETIEWGENWSSVVFEAAGAAEWLAAMFSFPVGLEDTDFSSNGGGPPDRWTEFEDLTTDRALWHILHWRSTCSLRLDAFLTGDERQTPSVNAASATLWAQLTETLAPIVGVARSDRYSGLYFYVDPQVVPVSNRSDFTAVMTLTKEDWGDRITIERRQIGEAAQINLSGISYSNGATLPFCARANGTVFKRYAKSVQTVDRLLLTGQSQAVELAGLILARVNNPYPSLTLTQPSNNRFFDVAPPAYLVVNMEASDTPREVVFENRRFLVRRIVLNWNAEAQSFSLSLDAEAETFPELALSTPCPGVQTPPEQTTPEIITPSWPITPTPSSNFRWFAVMIESGGVYLTSNFLSDTPIWYSRPGLPDVFTSQTRLAISGGYGVLLASFAPLPGADVGVVYRLTDLTNGTWEFVGDENSLLAAAQGADPNIVRIEIGYAAKDPHHPTRLVVPYRGYNIFNFLIRMGLLISTDGVNFSPGFSVSRTLSQVSTGFAEGLSWYGANGRISAYLYSESIVDSAKASLLSTDHGVTGIDLPNINGVYPFWRGARLGASLQAVAVASGLRYANDYGLNPIAASAVGYTPVFARTDDTGATAMAITIDNGFIFYSRDGGRTYAAKAAPGGSNIVGVVALLPKAWVAYGNGLLAYASDVSQSIPNWRSKLAGLPQNNILSADLVR